MGSSFRIGSVSVAALTDAGENFTAERASLRGTNRQREALHILPGDYDQFCGKILIVFSNRQCISFASSILSKGFVMAGVKDGQSYPLSESNVARNVIAHEIGHAVGLRHNSNPEMLMCGRSASFQPDEFRPIFPSCRYGPPKIARTLSPEQIVIMHLNTGGSFAIRRSFWYGRRCGS